MKITSDYTITLSIDLTEKEGFPYEDVPLVRHIDIEATWNEIRVVLTDLQNSVGVDNTHMIPEKFRKRIKAEFQAALDKIISEQ